MPVVGVFSQIWVFGFIWVAGLFAESGLWKNLETTLFLQSLAFGESLYSTHLTNSVKVYEFSTLFMYILCIFKVNKKKSDELKKRSSSSLFRSRWFRFIRWSAREVEVTRVTSYSLRHFADVGSLCLVTLVSNIKLHHGRPHLGARGSSLFL